MPDPTISSIFWDVKASTLLEFFFAFWDVKASNILEFFSTIAWQFFAFVIICMFRNNLITLMNRMTKITTPIGSTEFSEGLHVVELKAEGIVGAVFDEVTATDHSAVASRLPHASGTATPTAVGTTEPVPEPAPVDAEAALYSNPTGVVLESYQSLERALAFYGQRGPQKISGSYKYGRHMLLSRLKEANLISDSEYSALAELLKLRNIAEGSDSSVDPSEARRFRDVASRLEAFYRSKLQPEA